MDKEASGRRCLSGCSGTGFDDFYAEKATALETDEDAASVTGGDHPVE